MQCTYGTFWRILRNCFIWIGIACVKDDAVCTVYDTIWDDLPNRFQTYGGSIRKVLRKFNFFSKAHRRPLLPSC